jgi:Family of unknown function (DUF6516)
MKKRKGPTKQVDERTRVRCAAGMGAIREELWVDEDGNVVRYNYAFINHHVYNGDNGRVLGYDNAHGYHERHYKGTAEPYDYTTHEALVEKFFGEVEELREERKDEGDAAVKRFRRSSR